MEIPSFKYCKTNFMSGGGEVMSLQKINGNKIYNKRAITSKIDNIIDDLYTHHLKKLNKLFYVIRN